MNAASPVKRRALGALDPNACSPSKVARRHDGKLFSSSTQQQQRSPIKAKSVTPRQAFPAVTVSGTPEKEMGTESRKRRSPTPTFTSTPPLESVARDSEPAAKRACLEDAREDALGGRPESPPSSSWTTRTSGTVRQRSASPATPSVFDNSAIDNSQVTILTEPDATAPAPVPAVAPWPAPRTIRRLTREQAREKAEIIRLRLGLASYKVRTGQTDVPLDRLEAQHATASFSSTSLPSPSQDQSQTQSQNQGRSRSSTSTSTSTSTSFTLPANASFTSTTSTPGKGGSRRPLPGAPLRRASSSVSVSFDSDVVREAPPSRSVLLEEARLAIARDERRQQQQPQHYNHQHHNRHHNQQHPHQPQLPRYNNNNNNHTHTHTHQRRQSEALGTRHDARRYMHGSTEHSAIPPRPQTAVGVTGSGSGSSSSMSFERRVSLVGDATRGNVRDRNAREGGEGGDEDEEGRGGAASGLLSLARS